MTPVMVVTGGSRGIGAAIAALAGKRGYKVCLNYNRARERAERVAAAIRDNGGTALAVQADMAREADIARLFAACDDAFGPATALVNNAGVASIPAPIAEIARAEIERVFAVNAFAPMLCAREAVRRMSTARGGRGGVIVNISSRAAVHGRLAGKVPYAASKGAVDAFTVGLATEVATEGIRVAAVRPGLVLTEIFDNQGGPERVRARARAGVPMGRPGLPEEIAGAVLWLCSAEASYVTGAILDIGGGR